MDNINEPFKKFKGKKAKILKPHMHEGEIATFLDLEFVMGKPALKFEGEYNSFFVFDTNEIKFLED